MSTPSSPSQSTRISLAPPRTPLVRVVSTFTKRRYGMTMEPLLAIGHNSRVLRSLLRLEQGVARWSSLDEELKHLANAAVAGRIGCSWCIDFGYFLGLRDGMEAAKFESLPRWREADCYSPLERLVIEYAEAMTETPVAVTDEMVAALREHLSDEQLVELTEQISVENLRSRTNAALGLTSQGYRATCELRPS
jgi:alkylhydroperoxidase family enzyme